MLPSLTHSEIDGCAMLSADAKAFCDPKNEMASLGVIVPRLYRCSDIRVNSPVDTRLSYRPGMKTIGSRLRARRKELKLTQVQVAQRAGIKQGTLSELETDKTNAPAGLTLAGLCRALETNARWVLEGKGDHVASYPRSDSEQEAMELFQAMTPEQQELWVKIGQTMIDQNRPGPAGPELRPPLN